MDDDDASRWTRGWVAGVGLMLVLTAMAPAGQAFAVLSTADPCVGVSLDPPGAAVGECETASSTANHVLTGGSAGTSSSSFTDLDATASGEDVQVAWQTEARETEVVAFHVYRGSHPSAMHHVAETPAEADSFTDSDAILSGEAVWYAVAIEFSDGSIEYSDPVLVDGVHVG